MISESALHQLTQQITSAASQIDSLFAATLNKMPADVSVVDAVAMFQAVIPVGGLRLSVEWNGHDESPRVSWHLTTGTESHSAGALSALVRIFAAHGTKSDTLAALDRATRERTQHEREREIDEAVERGFPG